MPSVFGVRVTLAHIAVALTCSPAAAQGDIAPTEITRLARELAKEQTYEAIDGKTQCSQFARDLVQKILGKSEPLDALQGKVADQHKTLSDPNSDWAALGFGRADEDRRQLLFKKAQDLANDGELVLVVYNPQPPATGHIALVVPGVLAQSDNWSARVPVIAQAGTVNPRQKTDEKEKSVFSSLELDHGFAPEQVVDMEIFLYLSP